MSKRGRPRKPLGSTSGVTAYRRGGRWLARVYWRAPDTGIYAPMERWGATEREARRRLEEALAGATVRGTVAATGHTLADAIAGWLGSLTGRTTGTMEQYKIAGRAVTAAIGALTLAELTPARISAYYARVASERVGWEQHRVVIRGACAYAVSAGWSTTDPAKAAASPRRSPTDGPPPGRVLSQREIDALFAALDAGTGERSGVPFLADACELALASAARISEMLALHWEQFEWEPSLVTLSHHLDAHGVRQAGRKSGGDPVTVELPTGVRDRFAERQKRVGGEIVFPSRAGTYRTRQNVARSLREFIKRAGLEPFHWHDLRRTAITAVTHRLGAHTGQALAGHASLRTTESFYVGQRHTAPAGASEVLGELGRIPEGHIRDELTGNIIDTSTLTEPDEWEGWG